MTVTESALSAVSGDPLRVLLVEDNEEDAFTVQRSLSATKRPRFSLATASTWSECQSKLADKAADVVLLDLHLPDADGLDLVRSALHTASGVPILILTGTENDQVAMEAIQLGAQDYLVKSDLNTSSLRRSICHAIERHQLRESLKRTHHERMKMKDDFLSRVSHELLTPLSAIYQFIDILGSTIDSREGAEPLALRQHQLLEILMRNAVQLRRMIGDLMEATRIDTGKLNLELGILNTRRCLELAVQSSAPEIERRQLSLSTDFAAELPPVFADETRVRQIIGNLLSNAIKFTPTRGSIAVRASRSTEDPEFLHVSVADTGHGIPEEARPQIFERLYQDGRNLTGSRRGLGIGLYVCREVVTRMGGSIWVESEQGHGSCFHFTLPIHSTERLLRERIDPSRPSSLIVIGVDAGGQPTEVVPAEQLVRELHAMLSGLVWTQYDVVLPCPPASGSVRLLAVVAQTDEPGSQAICTRIEKAIADLLQPFATKCRTAVRAHPLGTSQPELAPFATHIDELLERSATAGDLFAPAAPAPDAGSGNPTA